MCHRGVLCRHGAVHSDAGMAAPAAVRGMERLRDMGSSRVRKRSKSEEPRSCRSRDAELAIESQHRPLITDRSVNKCIMLITGVLIVWAVHLCSVASKPGMQINPPAPSHLLLEALNRQQPQEAHSHQGGVPGCRKLFRGSMTPLDDIVFQLNSELGLLNSNYPNMTIHGPEYDDFQLNSAYPNKTDEFRILNGVTPPGKLLPVQNEKVVLDVINHRNQRVLMLKSVRKAGTRVGIHVHPHGGYVLILKGEVTDFIEGQPAKTYGPNQAYYMPACTLMSVANLGVEDVELVDMFVGPRGQPYVQILELGWKWDRTESFTDSRRPEN